MEEVRPYWDEAIPDFGIPRPDKKLIYRFWKEQQVQEAAFQEALCQARERDRARETTPRD